MKKTSSLYQSKKEFYTDPVNGRFNKIRLITMFIVASLFFLTPWIDYNTHQAFLFDISYNKLYFFKAVFWPQDFVLIALFFIFCIILLFAGTLYSGRIWCGFLCPQSIWIKMSAFFARFLEGKRYSRLKFDEASFSSKKIGILFLKHFFWIVLSLLTSFTFMGYFIPIKWLFNSILNLDIFYRSFFWILFFCLLTYFNIGWFKEQFCFLVCPYARFQSVMFDENTLIVSYDKNRGEKRGARSKHLNYKDHGLGDCTDCKKCVTCCPTGIDIRDGLQIECISCGACIDACNDVMQKMNYKPNLISFAREKNIFTKVTKIKLFAYTFLLTMLLILILYISYTRPLLHVNVARSQYQLFNVNKDNIVENFFFLKLMNKSDSIREYVVVLEPNFFKFNGKSNLILKPGDMTILNYIVTLEKNAVKENFLDVNFCILDIKAKKNICKKSKFVLPGGDF